MGVKLGTLYYMSMQSQNELDRKGISKDADNGAVEDDKMRIPKVTKGYLLQFGEETLEKMQTEQLDALTVEHLSLGSDFDRNLEQARIR